MANVYLEYQNFFFPCIRRCNRVFLINSSTDAPYAVYNVFHQNHQLLRSCSKIDTKVFKGINEQINLRIDYALISLSTQQIYINAEGMIDDNSLIQKFFDALPNYFSSIEEQENED